MVKDYKWNLFKNIALMVSIILLSGCMQKRVQDYTMIALGYRHMGEYDKAIEFYTSAIDLNPKAAEIYNDRGLVFAAKKNYDQAISDYNRAIEINPNLHAAFNNRGIAYSEKGDQQKAISDFNRAIEIKKDYALAYLNRGLAYYRSGDNNRAIDDYNQIIGIKSGISKSTLSDTYFNRGLAYSSDGVCDKAISDFDHAVQSNPQSAWNLAEVALVLATSPDGKCRDGERALRFAEKAVRIRKTAMVMRALAAAYAETGKFEKAVSAQEEALALLQKEVKSDASATMEYYTRQLQSYKNSIPWREKNTLIPASKK